MTNDRRRLAWDLLTARWRALRDGFTPGCIQALSATIDFAFDVGHLTADERELWHRRIPTCPGHDDEGGRNWCAYCGKLPADDQL